MLKRGYAIAAACLAAAVAATAFTPNGKSPTFAAQTHRHPNAIANSAYKGGIKSMSAHIIASDDALCICGTSCAIRLCLCR